MINILLGGGGRKKFELFLRKEKISKKQEIIYHSVDKRFPKFGKLFLVWKIFICYYILLVITMV